MTARVRREGATLTWLCGACGFPIAPGSGYLSVDARDASNVAHDRLASRGVKTLGQLLAMPDDVEWRALHEVCEIDPDGPSFWIDVETAQTHAALLLRTADLMAKTWLDATDWTDVLTAAATATEGTPT